MLLLVLAVCQQASITASDNATVIVTRTWQICADLITHMQCVN